MENNKLNNETKIVYEIIVKYDKPKFDTKLTITEKSINFEKEKGLFKKTYKIVDSIAFEDIKVCNDKVKVSNKKSVVEIETTNKVYTVTCNNNAEAKKLVEKILQIKTGANLLERTSNKVAKIGKAVTKTAASVGTAVASVGAVATAINKNKKEIAKAVKVVKDVIIK